MTALAQRRSALERANEVRLERARVKREVAAGIIEFDMLLADPPPNLQGVTAYEALQWVPRVGASFARKILREAGHRAGLPISEMTTLGNLGASRRRELRAVIARKTGGS